MHLRIGPAARLIIAGMSPVSVACAEFARTLGFEVILCDPREEALVGVELPGIEVKAILPSMFISAGGCHAATAVVALTHDPRIDDLAMMEAVGTSAFYIGVMGSLQTSKLRAERLRRIGRLSDKQIARLHMPIGLSLGSKTPAEIALAVMAANMHSVGDIDTSLKRGTPAPISDPLTAPAPAAPAAPANGDPLSAAGAPAAAPATEAPAAAPAQGDAPAN